MALRWSLRAEGGAEFLLRLAALAEDAGLARLWISEGDQAAQPAAALLAGRTKRIRLATGITLAFVRSPHDTASNALQINEYSNGRFTLGLGPGEQRWIESSFGAPFAPQIGRLRECVMLTRRFMQALPGGESFSYEGSYYRVNHAARHASPGTAPPIHVAALGPKAAEMAGEVADGLLCHVLGSPEWLRSTVWPAVKRGRQRGGRERGPFELTATLICAIGGDVARGREHARRSIAFYATRPSMRAAIEALGFGEVAARTQGLPLAQATP